MFVRRLSHEDAKAFQALRLEGLKLHPEAFGASYEDETLQPLKQVAERLAANIVFGGYDASGKLCGVLGLRQETAPKIKHIATIWGVYVSPDGRGTGLASQLVQAAVAEARGSCAAVQLSVVTSNESAIRLYERSGFKLWAVDKNALRIDGIFHDEALMRLDFP